MDIEVDLSQLSPQGYASQAYASAETSEKDQKTPIVSQIPSFKEAFMAIADVGNTGGEQKQKATAHKKAQQTKPKSKKTQHRRRGAMSFR